LSKSFFVLATMTQRRRPAFTQTETGLGRLMRLLLIGGCLVLTAGCGTPGAPQPPSLGIPKPVSDLRALRKGDSVTLTWTAPTDTTDGELIRKPGKMVVSRTAPPPSQVVSTVAFAPVLKQEQATPPAAKDSLSGLVNSGADFATYSVVVQSSSGRAAAPSNQATVALVPALPPPAQLSASPVPLGISISWNQAWPPQNQTHFNVQYAYRVMRREQGAKSPVMIKQVGVSNQAMALIDTGIEWQKHYDYWITPVTLWQGASKKGEIEGEDSPLVSVFANDTFPPAVPAGLEAVFSALPGQPFIDLSWTPDTEPDLAGYNIYRHTGNEVPGKINPELVKVPAFRDTQVNRGTKYFYSVSAVDQRGNESGKSAEASETVPQP
jgi:hypothetical protein